MLEELKAKLSGEVEVLQHELNVVLPNEIRKAVELGDLRENSEYKAALERQEATDEVQRTVALLGSVVAEPPEATIYNVSSSQPWG